MKIYHRFFCCEYTIASHTHAPWVSDIQFIGKSTVSDGELLIASGLQYIFSSLSVCNNKIITVNI